MFSGVLVSTVPSDGWIRGTARQKINHVLKTGWQMTHWAIWPQFMCSLHRFTHKKGIFRCNKRLWHCNPTIVSLSVKFSVDCFHETKRPIESKIEIHSKLISKLPDCFFSAMQSTDILMTKEHSHLSQSSLNRWYLSFRPTDPDHWYWAISVQKTCCWQF